MGICKCLGNEKMVAHGSCGCSRSPKLKVVDIGLGQTHSIISEYMLVCKYERLLSTEIYNKISLDFRMQKTKKKHNLSKY